MKQLQNHTWQLKKYVVGEPKLDDFEQIHLPVPEIGKGQLLVKSLYLSIDPYMRGFISEKMRFILGSPDPIPLGSIMPAGVVGEVVESRSTDYKAGDIVEGAFGWQTYSVYDTADPVFPFSGKGLRKLDPEIAPISTAHGLLGMPGLTAYFGLVESLKAKKGETVVVSSAAGAVGQVVGQIAKILGCRCVGITGSDEKCTYITNELGFDAAINYKTTKNMHQALDKACPKGIDAYFDHVGGEMLEQVLHHINWHARILICGMTSEYNEVEPVMVPSIASLIFTKEACMFAKGVYSSSERFPEGLEQLTKWYQEGLLKYKEHIIEGFDKAPQALIGMLHGENVGKMIVKIG